MVTIVVLLLVDENELIKCFKWFLTYDKCYVYVSIISYSLPLHYTLWSVQLLSHV